MPEIQHGRLDFSISFNDHKMGLFELFLFFLRRMIFVYKIIRTFHE